MQVNAGRIQRLREGLQPRQQQCFDLIPLLFHLNYDGLPGFSGNETPFKIANYQPDDALIKQLQGLSRQRIPTQHLVAKAQLSALYLMGSSGSIGHSTSSDLDIWLCYNSELSNVAIHALAEKAERISEWAADFNLEVHFFLMDAHKFIGDEQTSLTGENCGTTQKVLLLDEFYRTAQLLAGNIPAWWLIPAACEEKYTETLNAFYDEGLLRKDECTDFGGISSLPGGEFIGAGMWQIYKAIDSPYKSVLKLILLEIYARGYPEINSLAHTYKNTIYRMQLSLDDLDPYIMLYRRIEGYLKERGEHERLELIRRCFYYKVSLNLSRTHRSHNWRRQLMDYLVNEWGWDGAKLRHLDNFRSWSIEQVITERKGLVTELTRSYRFLTEFASEHGSDHLMSQRDLLVLSRKLHTAFDRRPGKIDFINIGLDTDLSHEKIHFQERESKQEPGVFLWAVYNKPIEDQPAPLKYSKSLLETMLWAHLNGLLSAHLHLPVYPSQEKVTEFEVRSTLASIRQYIPYPRPEISSQAYNHPAQLTKIVIFLNLGRDPLHYLSTKGLQKISARSDSLDFSAQRENLVVSLDMVLVNSWGETVVERFTDEDALPKALKSLINRLKKQNGLSSPAVETVCHNPTRPQAIAARVRQLFSDALEAVNSPHSSENTRFVFSVRDKYQVFQYFRRVTNYVAIESTEELIQFLGAEQESYSPVVFDPQHSDENKAIAELYRLHEANCISLCIEHLEDESVINIIDEHGSLVQFKQPQQSMATALSPIVRFLKVTEHRQRSNTEAEHMPERSIRCYQVNRHGKQVKLEKLKLGGLITEGRFISVQVNVDISETGEQDYYIVCNEKEFNSNLLGQEMFSALASYVLGLRASGTRYPIYITEIAMTEAIIESLPYGHDQTRHYIDLKLKIEKRINHGLTLD
ncbi:adenylate cyclase class 1 [Reinekea marinisedimentorum]|uniref:Adenylate cyclase class 1 n=2 Tax=Reinekea marinisedimentorum TaxID=230495 RepID=A0A4R3IB53_9GAMM|nr:adenylate cyclase class 1 [Reinekea marinisedimentorum]